MSTTRHSSSVVKETKVEVDHCGPPRAERPMAEAAATQDSSIASDVKGNFFLDFSCFLVDFHRLLVVFG